MNYVKSRLEQECSYGKFKQYDTIKVVSNKGNHKGFLCSYVLSSDKEGRPNGYDCIVLITKKSEMYFHYATDEDSIEGVYSTRCVLLEKDTFSVPTKILRDFSNKIRNDILNQNYEDMAL